MLVYRAHFIAPEILAAILISAESHNSPPLFELDPTGFALAPFNLAGFVEIDDIFGFLIGVFHNPLDILIRNQNDRLPAAVAATGASEAEEMFPLLSHIPDIPW